MKSIGEMLKTLKEEVGKAIKVIGDAIMAVFDSLDFIADAWSEFGVGVESLLSGNFAEAGQAFAQAFQTFLDPDNWEAVGEAILEGLEDVGYAINDAILGFIGISMKESIGISTKETC